MSIIKHKPCANCGALMIYNNLLGIWECRLCGNCEELFNPHQSRWPIGVR